MHFYMFNPSDFNNSARHLSLVERAIYRDLIDMYYHTEQAIDTSDMDKLARRLLCTSSEYRASLDYVLDEFFVKRGKRHHHHRIDKEIKNYKFRKGDTSGHEGVTQQVTNGHDGITYQNKDGHTSVTHEVTTCHKDITHDGVTMTDAERKRKSRQDKRNMINDLINIGVSVDKSIKLTDLRELHAKHVDNVTTSIANDVTQVVTAGHTTCHEGHAKNAAITSNHELSTSNQKPVSDNDAHTSAGKAIVDSSVTSITNQPTVTQPVTTKADQIRSQHSIDIENWVAPTIDEMRGELFRAGKLMQLTDDQYDLHVKDFKAHYAEQALLGNPIITESNRKAKLRKWLAGEVDKESANQARQDKAKGRFTTDNENWGTTTKSSSHFDSDLPPIYHPSHETAKTDDNMPLFLNGCKRMPLPGMTNPETEAYVDRYVQPGEARVAAYDRLLNDMQEAV